MGRTGRSLDTPDGIFVQIPSYRDPECGATIRDAFAKAAHPERIFVGVCEQVLPGDDDDLGIPAEIAERVRIEKYLGVVNGEAIIGGNIFRDLFSSVRDVVGGRAGGYERALSGARDAAVEDMIEAAKEMGADGAIGVDFDYAVLGESNGMMLVAVSGTAVKMG